MVPRLVSSMWSLQKSFNSVVQVLEEIMDLMRTLAEAFTLIVVPANVHSAVGSIFTQARTFAGSCLFRDCNSESPVSAVGSKKHPYDSLSRN